MDIKESILDCIGHTPMVKLNRISEGLGCTLVAKLDHLNPGGSVKDRIGVAMIRDAESKGLLKPGGTITEGTAGNTGLGLAIAANVLGYKCVFCLPDKMSKEKIDLLRAYGAKVIVTPTAVEKDDPRHYSQVAQRIAKETPGGWFAGQFQNQANPEVHHATTAKEIWEQTDGKIDGFVSAVGTGGTLAGVSAGLKGRSNRVKVALADPMGAALYSYYTTGELRSEGNSITEGIGQGRITANLEGFQPDLSFQVPDSEALPIIFDLVQEEGLCLGGSSGINIAGAIRLAKELGPGHTIVTMLCDYGTRYQSKMFNPDFLRGKELPVPAWMERTPDIDVPFEDVA